MAQTRPVLLDPNLTVRTAVSGLTMPTGLAFLAADDMLVIEKSTGRVKRVTGGTVQQTPVLDLAVNSASERGLLGIALDPAFATNHFVYLYWTCQAPVPGDPAVPSLRECADQPQLGADTDDILAVPLLGNRLDRFTWDGTALKFDRNLIKLHSFQNDGVPFPPGQGDEGQPIGGNHNGGVITFGPDGKLYLFFGDNGRRGWLQNLVNGPSPNGLELMQDDQFGGPQPDRNHFTGVVLRLNTDGTAPDDNPFFTAGASMGGEVGANIQKIWSYGHRNSFGMAWDMAAKNLWLQENGDDSFDEINRVPAGMNGGWVQLIGPSSRFNEFREIETSQRFFGLQQRRFPPTLLATTGAQALSRLYMLPGAAYKEPEFSWKYAVAPAGMGFQTGDGIGKQYNGDLFMGFSTPQMLGGSLFRFRLTADRKDLMFTDPRLADRVADNTGKNNITESERLLVGTNFGVVTSVQTGPNGHLWITSLLAGAVYEISGQELTSCAKDMTASMAVLPGAIQFDPAGHRYSQQVSVVNSGLEAIDGPVTLILQGLTGAIASSDGTTACGTAGAPYVMVAPGADGRLDPGETATVTLNFTEQGGNNITYQPVVVAGPGRR
jgi:glucose/arabinose dehydrogenase